MIIYPDNNLDFYFGWTFNNVRSWWRTDDNPVSLSDLKAIQDAVLTCIETNRSTPAQSVEEAKLYAITFNDGSVIKPPPLYTEVNLKEGQKNADFKRRSREGEIIMTPYLRALVSVTQYPGLKTSQDPVLDRSDYRWHALERFGYATRMESGPNSGSFYYVILGKYIYTVTSYSDDDVSATIGSYRYCTDASSGWAYPPEVTADQLYERVVLHRNDNRSLITNVLAKANKQSVDVLTAFAELPESVVSVIKGAKFLARAAKDIKKRQFNLSRAYQRREARYTKIHKQRIMRVDRRLRTQKLSAVKRAELEEYRKRLVWNHSDQLKRTADELASESANVWLNYRYNIMTNVYLAQDVFTALQKFRKQFVTAKGKLGNLWTADINGYSFEIDTTSRVVIKRRFSAELANKGFSVISNDIFVTAWERIPLSFVIDWFVNVGDFLSAQNYNYRWEQQGSTLSHFSSGSGSTVLPGHTDWEIPPRTKYNVRVYVRDTINPSNCIGLDYKPSLGLERKIDAIALMWRPVRSILHKKD